MRYIVELPPSAPNTLYDTRFAREDVSRPYMREGVRHSAGERVMAVAAVAEERSREQKAVLT